MDTAYLREYVTLADCGSFTAAAQRMHLTQSTLSKHISSLERELDCDLFVRDKKGIKLTHAGVAFYRATLKSLAALREAEAAVRDASGEATDVAIDDTVGAPDVRLRTLCRIACGRFALTPQETGALILYLEDRGFDAIQAELGLDRDSLADVLASVYGKLGVDDKQAAMDVIYSISE